MDAKDSLKLVLDALYYHKKQTITRAVLIDLLRGSETRAIVDSGLIHSDFFGAGDKHEEPHYTAVIDQAIVEKYLTESDGHLSYTPKGNKFRKAPTSFELEDESADKEPSKGDEAMLDSIAENALKNGNFDGDSVEDAIDQPLLPPTTGMRSSRMIHLLQAIDRKLSLDDYAEQNQLDFDELLDDLEHLVQRGTQLDISYFVDEVLDAEAQDEIFDYFDSVNGNVEKAINEFYGVYQPEEIRLARLVWK